MSKSRILLVEPNAETARVITEYLKKIYDIDVAKSAQEGVHVADKARPDLVVLELAMPHHNGFAFLHEFRSYPEWKDIPVVIHSHLDVTEAAMSRSWGDLGAVAYMYKPTTTLKKLELEIKNALAG